MLKGFINWLKGLFGKREEICVCKEPVEIKQVENIDKPAVVEKKIDNTKKTIEKNIENIDVNKRKELKDNVKKEVINDYTKAHKTEKIDNTLKNVEKVDKIKRVQKNKSNKKQSEKVEKKVKNISAESQQTEQVEKPKKKTTRKTTNKEDKKD